MIKPYVLCSFPSSLPPWQQQQHREGKRKLECAATFSLFGNIVSMKAVKLSGALRDVLLLSFIDAKLSVVQYDPTQHDLKTLSLHCFEEDELKGEHEHSLNQ